MSCPRRLSAQHQPHQVSYAHPHHHCKAVFGCSMPCLCATAVQSCPLSKRPSDCVCLGLALPAGIVHYCSVVLPTACKVACSCIIPCAANGSNSLLSSVFQKLADTTMRPFSALQVTELAVFCFLIGTACVCRCTRQDPYCYPPSTSLSSELTSRGQHANTCTFAITTRCTHTHTHPNPS